MAMGREQDYECMVYLSSSRKIVLIEQYVGQVQTFGDSAINSPESFQSSESFPGSNYADSNFDASSHEPLLDLDILSDVKIAGRPRAPVTNGRDPNENRIQVISSSIYS